jgi:(+)-trans-carveol dehydrogenase
MRMPRLAGKVVFITGAARGQGRSHAVRFAEEGARVIAVDACRDIPGIPYALGTQGDLAETARLVREVGGEILPLVADVRSLEQLMLAVDAGVTRFGRLDVVLANAGVNSPRPEGLTREIWDLVVDINLSGVWRTVRATVPHIVAGGEGGSVILTSSAAGLRGYANVGHYTAAKHGVNGLMKTLALELAAHRIRVNSLNPTQVDTPMIMNDPMFRLFCPDLENPGREEFAPISQAMNALPVPWVDPVDVSNAALFLASDDARYVTGVALPVDAGVLVK